MATEDLARRRRQLLQALLAFAECGPAGVHETHEAREPRGPELDRAEAQSAGWRSKTPSITSTLSVCQIATGMLMYVSPVKFSAPPWKSSTCGRPLSR
jgi:hypothetical protein